MKKIRDIIISIEKPIDNSVGWLSPLGDGTFRFKIYSFGVWTDVSLGTQGPKGDKGDKGDTGAQGPAGQGWGNKWHIKNCILKFNGRPFVQPEDPSWVYIGIGLSNGEHGIIERCKFIENGGKTAIYAHNNPFLSSVIKKEISLKVGATLDIIQCDLGNKGTEILTTTSSVADTYDICSIIGCKNNSGVVVKPYSNGKQNWKVSLVNSDGDIEYTK